MYAFVVFLGLTFGLAVLMEVRDEIVPVKTPAALSHTISVALAAGTCWALNYSVFTSFGQPLRAAWMHPVATGIALIGAGEFLRQLVNAIAGRVSAAKTA